MQSTTENEPCTIMFCTYFRNLQRFMFLQLKLFKCEISHKAIRASIDIRSLRNLSQIRTFLVDVYPVTGWLTRLLQIFNGKIIYCNKSPIFSWASCRGGKWFVIGRNPWPRPHQKGRRLASKHRITLEKSLIIPNFWAIFPAGIQGFLEILQLNGLNSATLDITICLDS